jgi:hypothetical protein
MAIIMLRFQPKWTTKRGSDACILELMGEVDPI